MFASSRMTSPLELQEVGRLILLGVGSRLEGDFGIKLISNDFQRSITHRRHLRGGVLFKGTVVSIHIAANKSLPMQQLAEANAVVGQGIEGDRYFWGIGTYSHSRDVSRDVTLIEIETIEALRQKGVFFESGRGPEKRCHARRSSQPPGRAHVSCGESMPAGHQAL